MLHAEQPDPLSAPRIVSSGLPIGILVAYIPCLKVDGGGKLNYLSCFVVLAPGQQQLG